EQLLTQQRPIGKVDERAEVLDALLREDVAFLGERSLGGFRGYRDGWTGVGPLQLLQGCMQDVNHGEEDEVELLLRVLREQQVVDVGDADFRREAGIDRTASGALTIEIAARVVRVDDIAADYAEAFEVRIEERRVRIHVQHARNADAQRLSPFDQDSPLARCPCPLPLRRRVRHTLNAAWPERLL